MNDDGDEVVLKNENEFIQQRNQLNQEEAVHAAMYDTLIDKFTDGSFIS